MKKLILLFGLIVLTTTIYSQGRGFKSVREVTDKNQASIENNYYALIIGNNTYNDPAITSLDEPVNDAGLLYNVLIKEYTFAKQNVTFLKNATYVQMITAFDELSNKVSEDDNLLIFYAGHGWWDENKELGYWLPSDAKKSNTAFWIRNSTISDYMSSIKSKHTLLIADACFSGSIFKTRTAFNDASPAIKRLYQLPSKTAMTSGNLKEVPDKSAFLEYLVKRLQNNTNKYITADQLFASFRIAVMNNSNTEPQLGTIQNAGDEGGEFIFIKRTQSNNNNNNTEIKETEIEEESITPLVTYGNLQINNYLQGKLYIDGTFKQTANQNKRITIKDLPSGRHTIKIVTDNETWQQSVTIQNKQTSTLTAKSSYVPPKEENKKDLPKVLTDSRDGKTYKIVEIGSQIWMAENLAYKPNSGNYWAYDNDQSNVSKYGYLYDWETAKQVCPSGWKLPTEEEFETLLNNYRGSNDVKANYTALIPSGNSGFSALLGGYRDDDGTFNSSGYVAYFWSASQGDSTYAWHLYITSNNEYADMNYYNKSLGFSVRCLQDN